MSANKSPSIWCRMFGCKTCVPAGGEMAGLPQSHCYYCGMRTSFAAEYCQEYSEPLQKAHVGFLIARIWDRL